MASWAFIYEHPGSDAAEHAHRLDLGGQRTHLVPVGSVDQAPAVARALADQGVSLIELCGGFDTATAARVVAAVDGRAAVGHVTYAVESLAAANRYAEQAAADAPTSAI